MSGTILHGTLIDCHSCDHHNEGCLPNPGGEIRVLNTLLGCLANWVLWQYTNYWGRRAQLVNCPLKVYIFLLSVIKNDFFNLWLIVKAVKQNPDQPVNAHATCFRIRKYKVNDAHVILWIWRGNGLFERRHVDMLIVHTLHGSEHAWCTNRHIHIWMKTIRKNP